MSVYIVYKNNVYKNVTQKLKIFVRILKSRNPKKSSTTWNFQFLLFLQSTNLNQDFQNSKPKFKNQNLNLGKNYVHADDNLHLQFHKYYAIDLEIF